MMRHRWVGAAVVCAIGACARPQPSTLEVEFLSPNGPSRTPYSPAVRVGNLLFVSGQVGTDSAGRLVAGGIQVEARQALNNVGALLKKSGSSLDRVVKCTVLLSDMKEYAAMNEIYATYFTNHKPARTTMGVTSLPLGAVIEVDCIAVVE